MRIYSVSQSGKTCGIVCNLQRYSVHDGPGIRTVIFLKGCPLRCRWCSNPESQSFAPELAFRLSKCLGLSKCGACLAADGVKAGPDNLPRFPADRTRKGALSAAALCPADALVVYGRRMTAEEAVAEAEKDAAFYSRSGGGLTLSGGEALSQPDFALAILREAKERRLRTALETSGEAPWEVLEKACGLLDFIFYDIKCMDASKHRLQTGAENGRILENFRRLRKAYPSLPVRVRTPIIPGVNDAAEEIADIAKFAAEHGADYELLPYHAFGKPKYEALGRSYPMGDAILPEEKIKALREVAAQIIGGHS